MQLSSMPHRAGLLLFVLVITITPIAVQKAGAASLLLIQEWEQDNFALNGMTARTGARYINDGLTGIGEEIFLLDRLNVILLTDDIGQSSERANFSVPPIFSEGHAFAQYDNGVFTGLSDIDQGGNPAIGLLFDGGPGHPLDGMDFGNRLFLGPGALIYGSTHYNLVSSTFTVLATVPLPAALPLFVCAIGGLGFAGFGRKRS